MESRPLSKNHWMRPGSEAASARAGIRSGRSSQGGRRGRFGRGSSATKASAFGEGAEPQHGNQ